MLGLFTEVQYTDGRETPYMMNHRFRAFRKFTRAAEEVALETPPTPPQPQKTPPNPTKTQKNKQNITQ